MHKHRFFLHIFELISDIKINILLLKADKPIEATDRGTNTDSIFGQG